MCASHRWWSPLLCQPWSKLPAPKLGKVYFSRNVDKRICFDFFLHIYLNIIHAQVPRLGNYYINLNTSTCDDDWLITSGYHCTVSNALCITFVYNISEEVPPHNMLTAESIQAKLDALRIEGRPFPASLRPHQVII